MSVRSITVVGGGVSQKRSLLSAFVKLGFPLAWSESTVCIKGMNFLSSAVCVPLSSHSSSHCIALEVVQPVFSFLPQADRQASLLSVAVEPAPSSSSPPSSGSSLSPTADHSLPLGLFGPALPSRLSSAFASAAGMVHFPQLVTSPPSGPHPPFPPPSTASSSPQLYLKEIVIGAGEMGQVDRAVNELQSWGGARQRHALAVTVLPCGLRIRVHPSSHSALVLGTVDGVCQREWLDQWRSDDGIGAVPYAVKSGMPGLGEVALRGGDMAGLDVRVCGDPEVRAFFNESAAALDDDTHPDMNEEVFLTSPPSCRSAAALDMKAYVKTKLRERMGRL